jgi:hypothetical protein
VRTEQTPPDGGWRRRCWLPLLLLQVGAALADQGEVARFESEFEHTYETRQCISLPLLRQIRVLDDERLLFRSTSGAYYLNVLPRACRALDRDSTLAIETRSTQLCNVDWVRVLRPFAGPAGLRRGPACGLGMFERVNRRRVALPP